MSRPLVSVIIPTRDRAVLLQETLRSLQAQTYENWEAIVVDDHSSDDTVAILAEYQQRDPRIRPSKREASVGGAPVCRNQGVSLSRGDYILFLDSDDLLGPGCLASRVEALDAEPSLDFVVFLAAMFEDSPEDATTMWNAFTDRSDVARFLSIDAPWGPCCPLWRRAAVDRIGPWDETLPRFQDWDYHVRALIAGLSYAKHEVVDCYVRTAANQRATIGNAPQPDDSFAWLRHLADKVHAMVEGWPGATGEIQQLVVGLRYYYLRRLAARHGEEALEQWEPYRSHPQVSPWVYWTGRLHLARRSSKTVNRAMRFMFRHTWPSTLYTEFGSKTSYKAPLVAPRR